MTRCVECRSTQRFSFVHWEGFGRDYLYLASTIMLTLETQYATTPKSYIARYNAGLLQNCKDQMPVYLLGSNLQGFQRAKDVLEACQRALAVVNGEQHGDLKLHHAEEECETLLWTPNPQGWHVLNRDVYIFTSLHVKSTCMHPRPEVQAKRCDCRLFLRSFPFVFKTNGAMPTRGCE